MSVKFLNFFGRSGCPHVVTFDSCDLFHNETEKFKGKRMTCAERTSKATYICIFEGINHETRSTI